MENQKVPLIAAGVIVALSAAAFLYIRSSQTSTQAPGISIPAQPPAAPAQASAPAAPSEPLPLLDASDDYAARRGQSLFSQPVPPQWLKADKLIRRLTAAAFIVAEGGSPRDSLSFLRPRGKFKVKRVKGRVYVDPAAYARYDAVGDAAAALDAQAAARFINETQPLFQQACAELDARCDFRAALIKSAKLLLATPVVEGDLPLTPKVVTWAIGDESLEALAPAQKHLLRMGPANERKVQAKLRALALALGASEAELPSPKGYGFSAARPPRPR